MKLEEKRAKGYRPEQGIDPVAADMHASAVARRQAREQCGQCGGRDLSLTNGVCSGCHLRNERIREESLRQSHRRNARLGTRPITTPAPERCENCHAVGQTLRNGICLNCRLYQDLGRLAKPTATQPLTPPAPVFKGRRIAPNPALLAKRKERDT